MKNGIYVPQLAELISSLKLGLAGSDHNSIVLTVVQQEEEAVDDEEEVEEVIASSPLPLSKLEGHVPDSVLEGIAESGKEFGLTTSLRLAHFLAQAAVESANFTEVRENLNYSAKTLLKKYKNFFALGLIEELGQLADPYRGLQMSRLPTSPFDTPQMSRFPSPSHRLEDYVGHPDKIAMLMYGDRTDLGNRPFTNDGAMYWGRGYIHLTGRANYAAFAKFVNDDRVLSEPDVVATEYPLESALFFFKKIVPRLWKTCDQGTDEATILKVSILVNGKNKTTGLPNGLADRIIYFKKFATLLGLYDTQSKHDPKHPRK